MDAVVWLHVVAGAAETGDNKCQRSLLFQMLQVLVTFQTSSNHCLKLNKQVLDLQYMKTTETVVAIGMLATVLVRRPQAVPLGCRPTTYETCNAAQLVNVMFLIDVLGIEAPSECCGVAVPWCLAHQPTTCYFATEHGNLALLGSKDIWAAHP